MKLLALLFIVAVLIPCGVLAWFAQRAMKDEQAIYQRQHVLLAHEKSAALATRCRELLQEQLQAFEKATDDYLIADLEGDGLGAAPQESEVVRWKAALTQRYSLAERGYLGPMEDSKVGLAAVQNLEESAQLKNLALEDAPGIPAPLADKKAEFAGNLSESRVEVKLGEKLMESVEERSTGGLGGAADLEATVDTRGLNSFEKKLANIAASDPAPEAPAEPPTASPPVAVAGSSPSVPVAAMKAKTSQNESLALGKEAEIDRVDAELAKTDEMKAMDADSPKEETKVDQKFANRGLNRNLAEGAPRGGVKSEKDSLGTVAQEDKVRSGSEPELLGRALRSGLADDLMDAPKPATDGREKVSVAVRTVAPQHLSSEAQVSLARLSSQLAKPSSLDERMRSENSGIAGKLTDDAGFALVAWYRSPRRPEVIYGGEISVAKFLETLRALAPQTDASEENLCLAVLDQQGNPAFQSASGFSTDWSRPYVSREIGTMLPQWESAVYLLRPDALQVGARAAQWRLGLIVLAVLVAAIGGGALFWMETRRRWQEAQQKTDFVSQVSHELRTPLTAIQMFSDLLMKETPASDPVKSQRYASVISQESQRLTRLINTVLDFSRLDRKGVVLDRTECDLRQILEDTLERYRPHLESLGFTVTAVLPEGPVRLQADADRVAQILVNLLSNAEKYAADGRRIDVTLTQDAVAHAAVVAISDRGPGIPAGQERRIFQKFYRADDRLHSGIQGTGLGLTLARALARAHGGDVTCARREEGGSTFTLRLPT